MKHNTNERNWPIIIALHTALFYNISIRTIINILYIYEYMDIQEYFQINLNIFICIFLEFCYS